ncbi:MAG: hypothetical protein ACR2HR_06835 [Euzebya sp.]
MSNTTQIRLEVDQNGRPVAIELRDVLTGEVSGFIAGTSAQAAIGDEPISQEIAMALLGLDPSAAAQVRTTARVDLTDPVLGQAAADLADAIRSGDPRAVADAAAILLVMVVLGLSACNQDSGVGPDPTQGPGPEATGTSVAMTSFTDSGVTFDYPATWTVKAPEDQLAPDRLIEATGSEVQDGFPPLVGLSVGPAALGIDDLEASLTTAVLRVAAPQDQWDSQRATYEQIIDSFRFE